MFVTFLLRTFLLIVLTIFDEEVHYYDTVHYQECKINNRRDS